MTGQITKEEALRRIKTVHRGLAALLQDAPPGVAVKVNSALEAVPRPEYNPSSLAQTLAVDLHSNALTPKSLGAIAPSLGAVAKSGHNPYYMARALSSGIASGAINRRSVRKTAKALGGILDAAPKERNEYQGLARTLSKGFDTGKITRASLSLVLPLLKAAAKNGHNPRNLADTLIPGLTSEALTKRSLRIMGPSLTAMARRGHNPALLASPVIAGLGSKNITHQSLPRALRVLRPLLESVDAIGKETGHSYGRDESYRLQTVLGHGLKDRHITPISIRILAPHIEEAARRGAGSHSFLGAFVAGIRDGAITQSSARDLAKLFREMPKDWEHEQMLRHAIETHKLGVPIDKIGPYSKKLIERGHFPNPGLIHELHKAVMKGR